LNIVTAAVQEAGFTAAGDFLRPAAESGIIVPDGGCMSFVLIPFLCVPHGDFFGDTKIGDGYDSN